MRRLVGEADEACRLHGGTLAQKFLNDVEGDIVVQKLPPARMTDDLGPDQGLVQSADSGEGVELLALSLQTNLGCQNGSPCN